MTCAVSSAALSAVTLRDRWALFAVVRITITRSPVKIGIMLIAAPAVAMLLGTIASDGMAIPDGEIQIGALSAAGLIFAAVARGSLIRRRR